MGGVQGRCPFARLVLRTLPNFHSDVKPFSLECLSY